MVVAFVRTHPNLGVPVPHSKNVLSCRGRLPISRPYCFLQEHLGRVILDSFGLVFDSFV